MGLQFSLFELRQVLFISAVKTSSQYIHYSEVKCELEIDTIGTIILIRMKFNIMDFRCRRVYETNSIIREGKIMFIIQINLFSIYSLFLHLL
jgi:hypothetical protein